MEKSNTAPTFYMLVGLPGSGKSHLCKNALDGITVHSSDEIRQELTGDISRQDINADVFTLLHKRVIETLTSGESCIYDATNISWKYRKAFLQQLNKIKCRKVCILLATPFEVCVERNMHRDRKVPYGVIERMYKNFDIPYYNEGWDNIILSYPEDSEPYSYGSIESFIDSQREESQDTPHHSLTIGGHCDYCQTIYRDLMPPHPVLHRELMAATALHDCGKPFCKSFTNSKGNVTEVAHYYNHEKVGAYNSLFYKKPTGTETLEVAALIRWHMIPFFFKDWGEKTVNKYIAELTTDERLKDKMFWEALQILHKCDVSAH